MHFNELLKGRKVVILRFNKIMRKQSIAHLIAGIVVILHGIDQLEVYSGKPFFYFLMGVLMIFVEIKNDSVTKFSKTLVNSFYFIEAAVIVFIAFRNFEVYKKYIPSIYSLGRASYLYVGFNKLTKKSSKQ